MEIVCLKAEHGDAFIIKCDKGNEHGVIVVDGGPTHCSKWIVKELNKLSDIDLMILTHYDDDHIGGLLRYIEMHKDDTIFPVKRFVVNCASNIELSDSKNISYGQAISLRNLLNNISKKHPNIQWKDPVKEGDAFHLPFADIDILSPTDTALKYNLGKLEREIEEVNISSRRICCDMTSTLKSLSENPTKSPCMSSDAINMASLAFIIRDEQSSILMLGDAFPQNIESHLRGKGYTETNKLTVDYIKLSHHGSRNNISCSLLDIIDCSNFIISTNGGMGSSYHPDRETIAKILCHKERDLSTRTHLFFNYPLKVIKERNGELFTQEEMLEYNFCVTDDISYIL